MKEIKTENLLLLFVVICLFATCTPKAETLMSGDKTSDEYVEKDIDPTKTEKVAAFNKKDEAVLDKNSAKKIIGKRFNDVQNIKDVKLQQFKHNAPYYVTAKGKKNGEDVLVAVELERKGEELHSSEYNMLYTACIAKVCDACSFVIDKNGEISDCKCDVSSDDPTAISPCEHRQFIKTLEKNF